MIAREAVVAEARRWIGTPYHHAGRLRGVGVDCAMLLAEVYAAVGLVPPLSPESYPPDWHLNRGTERYLGWVERYATPVAQPGPGDVALFRWGRCLAHGAIVTAWPRAVHALVGEGVTETDLSADRRFRDREVRTFTLWG